MAEFRLLARNADTARIRGQSGSISTTSSEDLAPNGVSLSHRENERHTTSSDVINRAFTFPSFSPDGIAQR
jgi:hypothetical protein